MPLPATEPRWRGKRAALSPPAPVRSCAPRSRSQESGDPYSARQAVLSHKDDLMAMANEKDPMLVKFGGGVKEIEVRVIDSRLGAMVVVHLIVDCRDAMGANAVNTMAESLAPRIEQITGGRVYLRIISNLADCDWRQSGLQGRGDRRA